MLFLVYLLCAPIFLSGVMSMQSNKVIEGYPAGYLAKCPGSTKPTIITNKSLKHLEIVVSGIKSNDPKQRRKYNYFQMKEMAKDPSMDYSKRTMMYIGGFLDSTNFPFARTLEIYYKRLGYNVWLLDVNWFTTREYPAAARAMYAVARHAGEMIGNMTLLAGFDPKKFEMVGLSLGGQTVGLVAKRYKELIGTKFDRITALDPSGLCFRNLGPNQRIDTEDADFIDVIMTNSDTNGMGMPLGHVNFYVNGGISQPGQFIWTVCDDLCAHFRAYNIWLANLEYPHGFIGIKCNSPQQARDHECFDNKPRVTNYMGLNVDRTKTGIFYVATGNQFPFTLGVRALKKGSIRFNYLASAANVEDVIEI